MTITVANHHCKWSIGFRDHCPKGRLEKHIQLLGWSSSQFCSRGSYFLHGHCTVHSYHQSPKRFRPILSGAVDNSMEPDDDSKKESKDETEKVNNDMLKENLEKIIGADDSSFTGSDLATLIRKKYGRSYDVQLIKQEFMGRNFLALNVMWKYREQRSFPLTEEEYILRLDDVANTLRCWGAVSHIRSSLEKLKERPRIGKAVSIFIDMDESGGRANEWIYK